ncbi:MAG: hypothetical protein R3Y50_06335 [Rikenellaceae bacterium]
MKKNLIKLALTCLVSVCSFNAVKAQTVTVDPSIDIVSSYIWRGTYCAGTSVQPGMGLAIGDFSLSGWGSVDLSNSYQEMDFSASYSIGNFSIGLNDYWWTGMSETYLNAHLLEASVGVTISENFPLSLSWSTMISGPDKNADGDQMYSTFIEASYPFTVAGVEVTPSVSVSPWESMYHRSGTTGLGLTTVSVNAAKEIKITEKFSLPIFTQIILAPNQKNCYFVAGISLL